jgi:hypothetical protein
MMRDITQKKATSAPSKSSATLAYAGQVTLKPTDKTLKLPPQGSSKSRQPQGNQQTVKFALSLKDLKRIETVHDDDNALPDELHHFGKQVVRMPALFETMSHLEVDKREFMDDMHEHALAKVEEVRIHMEEALLEVAKHVQEFTVASDLKQTDAMDELTAQQRQRFETIRARYDKLESRIRALQIAIQEETAARMRHIEHVLGPIRAEVATYTSELEKETRIRNDRERELKSHLDACVGRLDESLKLEKNNREDRHRAAIIQVLGSAGGVDPPAVHKEWHERNDFESDIPRLARRQREMCEKDTMEVDNVQKDLDNARDLRIKGQDHVTTQINEFISRFRAHTLEEAPPKPLTLFVTTSKNARRTEVEIPINDTVSSLKKVIAKKTGVPTAPDNMILIYMGQELQNDVKIKDSPLDSLIQKVASRVEPTPEESTVQMIDREDRDGGGGHE